MSPTRKRYTREFKQNALKLWQDSGKSAAEIEEDLGLSSGQLYYWKNQFKKEATAQADGRAAESAEMNRLKKELALVKQERDILKKAISIFSQAKP